MPQEKIPYPEAPADACELIAAYADGPDPARARALAAEIFAEAPGPDHAARVQATLEWMITNWVEQSAGLYFPWVRRVLAERIALVLEPEDEFAVHACIDALLECEPQAGRDALDGNRPAVLHMSAAVASVVGATVVDEPERFADELRGLAAALRAQGGL